MGALLPSTLLLDARLESARRDRGTLMRLVQPKPAALEYALALAHHPKRARSLLGAARAAVQGGDPETARTRYQQLLQIWTVADDEMEGLAEARAAIATGK